MRFDKAMAITEPKAHMKLISFLKPIILVLLMVCLLQLTGFKDVAGFYAQSAALHSGFRDATTVPLKDPAKLNYNFTIKDLTGNKIKFETYQGKVIFLNMWATWCGPCRAEMADIQKLYEKIDKEKVAFVMLSIDEDRSNQKVIDYVSNKSFSFPVFLPSGYLPEQLQVPSIPTTFVISKDGTIVTKEVGSKNYNTDKFKKFLEDLSN
jgi:thiol-disulfide isomerase/thioredoxin